MSSQTLPWRSDRGAQFNAAERAVAGIAVSIYRLAAPIVSRFPGTILLSVMALTIVGVWIHALVFAYVDRAVLGGAAATGAEAAWYGYAPETISSLVSRYGGWPAGSSSLLGYLLYPLQFFLVRDLIMLGGIFGLFNIIPVYFIWWERKVAGRIQSRLGPMRVGGWHGWSQSFADGIKLVLKEDIVPDQADKPLFLAAPYFAVVPVMLTFMVLPLGATFAFRNLDVGLVFILAMLGAEVMAVILAGWASNNKWSVYGAMREACQMVSYEIPLGMALLIPVLIAGSLSLKDIGNAQSGGWFGWLAFSNPFAFAAFVAYFVASLASCKRAPFDLPESESELVAGFHTEYSGFRWALFFFAEYAGMFVVAALAAILFIGGWHSPLPMSWCGPLLDKLGLASDGVVADAIRGLFFCGPIWFLLKCVFLVYVQIWIRWTLPRIRIDQVLYSCVQVLLPLTMFLLLGVTLWVLAEQSGHAGFAMFAFVVRIVLGTVGLAMLLVFPAIAIYGFWHRRRLVGNLVQDAMPGS